MKNFLIAFFVFLIWSIFGMWYHSCIIKEICTDISTVNSVTIGKEAVTNNNKDSETTIKEPSNPFELNDENGNIIFKFPDNLGISANNNVINFPSGNAVFNESVFKFLNKNQDKELLITGLFNSDESSNNGALGLNRANFIKDILVKLELILIEYQ